jgi:hypothetical protein
LATKGRASALCHLKHWIFAPPVGTPIPCPNRMDKIHSPLNSHRNLSDNQDRRSLSKNSLGSLIITWNEQKRQDHFWPCLASFITRCSQLTLFGPSFSFLN